jgi:hypothetical protein
MESGRYDLVFLALARDCTSGASSFIRGIQRLSARGLNVMALVGENGSTDDTRSLLLRSDAPIRVIDTSVMESTRNRFERMARGRQLLADEARSIETESISVVDIDEPFLESLSLDALQSALSRLKRAEAFCVSATSQPTFYDLLAYEDESTSFVGLTDEINALKSRPLSYYRLFRNYVYPEQIRLTSRNDLWCTSSFNGLALYSSPTYRRGSYLHVGSGPWPCEHVTFNRVLSAQTKLPMVVASDLVLPMPPEHGPRGPLGFVWQRRRSIMGGG